jgi:hypothetical protein
VNIVGHVAVALRGTDSEDAREPTPRFLIGCMLPDLAAIARVRLARRPDGEVGRGVEFHHACDAVFHESRWFNERVVFVRDALVAHGVDRGPARACAHAGLEMVLDGALVSDAHVRDRARSTLREVAAAATAAADDDLVGLARVAQQSVWRARLEAIGGSLEPVRYTDTRFVAERLHRMTSGRRRIELPEDEIDMVAGVLQDVRADVARDAEDVVAEVQAGARASAVS